MLMVDAPSSFVAMVGQGSGGGGAGQAGQDVTGQSVLGHERGAVEAEGSARVEKGEVKPLRMERAAPCSRSVAMA